MRIIFSRKGFDSNAGGWPSPIIEGHPLSFPIPSDDPSEFTYGDLRNRTGELLENLTNKKMNDHCHLDPDIDDSALPRASDWRGAFGQASGAQGHLSKQGVTAGDLFLFWGWFRHVEKRGDAWKYVGEDEHRIFGWLQIEEALAVGNNPTNALLKFPWLDNHPHTKIGPGCWNSNTIYVATPTLRFAGEEFGSRGWGVFKSGWRLTIKEGRRSRWQVPDWLNPRRGGVGMSGSCKPESDRWHRDGYLNVGPGQEFVANLESDPQATAAALAWLRRVFSGEN